MLGIRASWEGLEIDPCPPPELGMVEVTRLWRGRTARIRFDARGYDPNRRPLLTIDGTLADRNVLTEKDWTSGETLEVEVSWEHERAATKDTSIRRIKV
jgi:cellobiose phosphorylase